VKKGAFRAKIVSFRDLFATAWPIFLITAIGLYVAYQFVEPAPPSKMTITTGAESGAYYGYAKRYADIVAKNGITLEVVTSAGSIQNLERLKSGEADLALIQGGIEDVVAADEKSRLRSLGSVAYEPVWVFYRSEDRLDKLYLLRGRRIAVGEEGSGIRGLAFKLLEANGIATNSNKLVALDDLDAVAALDNGDIDAAFIVAAPEAAVVQKMLHLPGVRVMSFVQADAYMRRFPFLSKIVLPRGVVDLARDNPARDTVLLATTANVVVRDDLHPALQSLVLQAMSEVNGRSGFFQRAGEFPAYRDHSFELSDEAKRYYKSGPPFLQRYLPFWLAVLAERFFVLVVPIVVLLLPLLRLAPTVYTWRVRSKIFRSYGDLKFMEDALRKGYDPAQHAEYVARLDRIEEDACARAVPIAYSDLVYTLRGHVEFVREKLRRLDLDAKGKP
jgi:TRAP transporter TAXI family solute receptor